MRDSVRLVLVVISVIILASPMTLVSRPIATTSEVAQQDVNTISQLGYTILFDDAHTALGSSSMTPGNASYLAWILEEYGYDCEMNFDQTLDSGILSGVDALILIFPMVALTPAEVTAVHNFVQAGGDLLLIGTDNSPTWHFSSVNLNAVSETYGITFNMDSWLGIAQTMTPHHLTQDVSSIHSNLDYKLKGCTLTVESPGTTVIEFQGNPVAAVSGAGSGKVAAVGCLASFLQYRWATTWQVEKDDLWQFSLNIFDWFAGIAPRHVEVPDMAIITIGPGPSLSPAELDNYDSFTGLIHDHTTYSDGQGTPMEMVWSGYTRGLDFMVISDHVYEDSTPSGKEGIAGALACREITESNGLDIELFIGAELSHGQHSLAFPLTTNIYAYTQAEMIAGAHAQGAIIALCHPTIGEQYMDAYTKWDAYGYDAIEVDNSGYTHGLWDEGFTRPFYAASDDHSPEFVGKVVNIVFVDTPSGPDGRLADTDVVDAILNRRVVIRDFVSNVIYGQKVWVDRYLELMVDAETEIANAKDAIELVSVSDNQTLLADLYLRDAEIAISRANPTRALRAALDAQTADALGLTLEISSPVPRILDPLDNYTLSLNITNNIGQGLEFNTTVFRMLEVTIDTVNEMVTIPSGSSILLNKSIQCGDLGYVLTAFNLHNFNSTVSIKSTLFGVGGLIYAGWLSSEIAIGYTGTNVTGMFPINRGDFRYFTSGTLFFNAGDGWQNTSMVFKTVTIEATVGPYLKGTVVSWYGVVYDMFGGRFEIVGNSFMITTDPLEPVTTTTTDQGEPFVIDPLLLVGIGGVAAVAIVIAVIFMKKKSV
ncbi:MAG: hypothetical protein ACFFCT_02055 [Candidatus Odinarchaeota archaeon]